MTCSNLLFPDRNSGVPSSPVAEARESSEKPNLKSPIQDVLIERSRLLQYSLQAGNLGYAL
ncbi:hypothetical protein E2C01_000344 [Portunus trituberculatus]|uniref:Uncharacterized protein n=1 Tax=Portunus trituberculatus TaxID=210409 RepID=A0A5B7CEW6_PORTR|nr:hypothetical protein [Portunus trituberculatus]